MEERVQHSRGGHCWERAWSGLTGALGMALAGCVRPGGRGLRSGGQATSKGPVEITYQTFFAQQRLDIMAPGFQVFKERNPNVKLNVLFDADHRNKLNTQIAADSALDLFIHDVWSTAKYVDANAIADLTGRMKTDKIDLARDYYFVGVEQWREDLRLPLLRHLHAAGLQQVFAPEVAGVADPWDKYNGKWTWTEFLDTARQVTKPAGGSSPRAPSAWPWTATGWTTSTATSRCG